MSPQFLLLHFLFEAHRSDGEARQVYLRYYGHTLEILRRATGLYAGELGRLGSEEGAPRAALMKAFAASPFAPVVSTIGTVNTSAAYIIKMATLADRLKDTPPASLNLEPGLAGLLKGLPQNYYPASQKPRPEFDYGQSPFFRRSGGMSRGPA